MEIASAVGDNGAVSKEVYKSGKSLESIIAVPQRRRWKVYKLCGSRVKVHRSGNAFKEALAEVLEDFFKVMIRVKEHQKSLWAHVDISSSSIYNDHVFVVHPPHSCYLFVTPIRKAEHVPIMLQSLSYVFDCPNINEIQMFGNDIDTLKDLALQKLSQGAFSSYRLCTSIFDANPLESHAEATAKRRAIIDKVVSADKKLLQEAQLEGKDRNKVVLKSTVRKPKHRFTSGGDDDEVKLKGLCVYSTSNMPPSSADRSDSVDDFSCFIRLEGSDVMNGLESLYGNDCVVAGKDIPKVLDVNNVLKEHLTGDCAQSSKRRRETSSAEGDSTDKSKSNTVLWVKSV